MFFQVKIFQKSEKIEEVLDSKKEESSFKNDLNVKVDKNKKSKKVEFKSI